MSSLKHCPFCGSAKIMAEGSDTRVAMVCQTCLARGPEVPLLQHCNGGREEWNARAIKWHPASEPPNHKLDVLATDGIVTAVAYHGTAGWMYSEDSYPLDSSYTHWRELPELPDKENK